MVGRLTRDPEMRATTTTGKNVTKMSLATNEYFNGKEQVEFHTVIAWEKTAEACATLKKGEMIAVAGRLATRKWTNPAGVEVKLTEVVANKVDFIRGPKPVEEPATF